MKGTGTGGHPPCTDRLALNWAGVIALAALGIGATLILASLKFGEGKISEGIFILLFGVPNTVVSMIAGYIGGRAMAAQQTTQTGPIVNTTQPVDVQPPTEAPSGAGETGE